MYPTAKILKRVPLTIEYRCPVLNWLTTDSIAKPNIYITKSFDESEYRVIELSCKSCKALHIFSIGE